MKPKFIGMNNTKSELKFKFRCKDQSDFNNWWKRIRIILFLRVFPFLAFKDFKF